MVGGRRTAAIVASQYPKRIPCITTVYAGSSESRALIRISERGASKAILMKFKADELNEIAAALNISPRTCEQVVYGTLNCKLNLGVAGQLDLQFR